MEPVVLLLYLTTFSAARATTYARAGYANQPHMEKPEIYPHPKDEYQSSSWFSKNKKAVEEAARRPVKNGRAKNVLFFLGDGMSLATLTASRIYSGQVSNGDSGEEGKLFFESFPHFSPIKTFNVDRQVPDSAGTATTFLTGVKANFQVLGCNANVASSEIDCDKMKANSVSSILQWAIDAGKVAGLVTNTRITHATPAASYAHVAHRNWEDDSFLPQNLTGSCKDIARQLIEDEPGKSLSVILGGGSRHFYPNLTGQKEPGADDESDPVNSGLRLDGRNLIQDWMKGQRSKLHKNQYAFVDKSHQLKQAVNDPSIVSLFGLFAPSHLLYTAERNILGDTGEGTHEPSLAQMVESAIEVLKRADKGKGWFLFVEGGRIDHAHHENQPTLALLETCHLDWTIEKATKSVDLDETLVMVTADHAHTMTINGYPPRGNRMVGGTMSHPKGGFTLKYPTLMYGTGPGHQANADNLDLTNMTDYFSRTHSAVYLKSSTHGGEDVGLYAAGPWAHLFTGLKDQSYIPHAAAYASCIGPFKDAQYPHCKEPFGKMVHKNSAKSPVPLISLIFLTIGQVIWLACD